MFDFSFFFFFSLNIWIWSKYFGLIPTWEKCSRGASDEKFFLTQKFPCADHSPPSRREKLYFGRDDDVQVFFFAFIQTKVGRYAKIRKWKIKKKNANWRKIQLKLSQFVYVCVVFHIFHITAASHWNHDRGRRRNVSSQPTMKSAPLATSTCVLFV